MDRFLSHSRAALGPRRRQPMAGQHLPWLGLALAVVLAACAGRSDFDDNAELSIRDEAATDESGETVLGRALMRRARDELAVLSQPASGSLQPAAGMTQPIAGTSQPAAGTSQPAAGTSQPAAGTSQPAAGTSQPAPASSQQARAMSSQAPVVSRPPRSLAADATSTTPASDIALSAAAASHVDATPAALDPAASATDGATGNAGAEGDQAERPGLFQRLFGWLSSRGAAAGGAATGTADATADAAAAADPARVTATAAGSPAGEPAGVAEPARIAPEPAVAEPAVAPRLATAPGPAIASPSAAPPSAGPGLNAPAGSPPGGTVDPRLAAEPPGPVTTPVPERASIASIAVPMTTGRSPPVPTRTTPSNAPTLTAALRSDISSSPATDVEPLDAAMLERGNFATLLGAMYGMVERCDSQTMMRDQALKSFRATYPLIDLDRREINDTDLRQRADGDFERSVAAARSGGSVNCDYVRSQSYRWNELATDLRRMDRQSALQYRQGLITEIRRGAGIGGFN